MAPNHQSEHITTRQHQATIRREQIIETAVQLFARQGFNGTSTKQIAQTIGITEGLIFHYFPTKADLLNAILETRHAFLGQLRAILVTAIAKNHPASEILPLIALHWLTLLKNEEAITRVFFSTAQTNPQVSLALQELIKEGKGRLAAYLHTRIEAGELRPDLPLETSAHMFMSSLFMFFIIYHTVSETDWQEKSHRFVTELVTSWFKGGYSR